MKKEDSDNKNEMLMTKIICQNKQNLSRKLGLKDLKKKITGYFSL